MKNIKKDFPIFKNNPGLVYLDSASTSQKPLSVIHAVEEFYASYTANIHRGVFSMAEKATEAYENTRSLIKNFINGYARHEVIFTNNTNGAINLVSEGWAKKYVHVGDIVLLTQMEHHANIIPWLRLKKENGARIVYIPVTKDGRLDYKSVDPKLFENIKLVSLTHASNVLGTINPVKEIIAYFKANGVEAKFLIDGAQAIPHLPVNVRELDCDFYAFSSHKMLGPSGVGVLWARQDILNEMDPLLVGSNMIRMVNEQVFTYADIPDKFEAGTGNLEGVIGLGAAIRYLQKIGMHTLYEYEKELVTYGLEKFSQHKELTLHGPENAEDRLAIFSFSISAIHPHDAAQILDEAQVAVRSGHHCCQVLMNVLGVPATLRASGYVYTTKEDIDLLFAGLEKVRKKFVS